MKKTTINGTLEVAAILTLLLIGFVAKTLTQTETYHYPIKYYRYYKTEKGVFIPSQEKVEVIYKTESESVKRSFSTPDIEIGEKTEILVHIHGDLSQTVLRMTKDDYESLFNE